MKSCSSLRMTPCTELSVTLAGFIYLSHYCDIPGKPLKVGSCIVIYKSRAHNSSWWESMSAGAGGCWSRVQSQEVINAVLCFLFLGPQPMEWFHHIEGESSTSANITPSRLLEVCLFNDSINHHQCFRAFARKNVQFIINKVTGDHGCGSAQEPGLNWLSFLFFQATNLEFDQLFSMNKVKISEDKGFSRREHSQRKSLGRDCSINGSLCNGEMMTQ